MKNRLLTLVEETGLKKDIPEFTVGDTVDVHQEILEGTKKRVQVYQGVVISRRGAGRPKGPTDTKEGEDHEESLDEPG